MMRLIVTCLFCFFSQLLFAQPANKSTPMPKPITAMDRWVDSVYQNLSINEKLGQLFMIAAYSGGEKYNRATIEKLITQNHIGGLIFMQGGPVREAKLNNYYQSLSKTPLLIGMDAEWGLGMRLKGVDDFPRQIMLGAMQDPKLVYKMAEAIAYQCRRLGVHIDFAPVVDINNNPNNPVINFRSFGENKIKVANYAKEYVLGLQDHGVIASAKHFPGHGNTDVDSHKDLPTISNSIKGLEDLELYPFREMINANVGSIMIAHLQVPALDNTPNTPTTLSKKVVSDLLKTKYKYQGLIITDALNMQGVTKHYGPGEVDLKAFLAGNDVLLFSQDVPMAIQKLKEALENGTLSEDRIEESVKKILKAKFVVGLNKWQPISATNITKDLNQYTSSIRTQIAKSAITLLSDQHNVIDNIRTKKATRIAYVGIGGQADNNFAKALQKRGIDEAYFVNENNATLIQKLKTYDAVIVGIHNVALYPGKNFGLPSENVRVANELLKNKNAIMVLLGNPYALKYFCDSKAALIAYDEKLETQIVAAEMVAGYLRPKGKLPVSVCSNFKEGSGIVSITTELGEKDKANAESNKEIRDIQHNHTATLEDRIVNTKNEGPKDNDDNKNKYYATNITNIPVSITCCVNPSALGADLQKLDKLDEIINSGIAKKAYPGCRVLAAKDGKVFYDRSFGYTSTDKQIMVEQNTIYDVASLTKVMATTLAVMKLYEQGKLNLYKTLGDYLPITKNSDKAHCIIKDVLLHQAGLKSWVAFYKETLDSNKAQRSDIYSFTYKSPYTIKVANNLYMHKHWVDTMWDRILQSPLGPKVYEYSDLDFIFLQKVVEKITGQSLDAYVTKEFYTPLKLKNTCFNPIAKGKSLKNIAPTEQDNYFRYQKVHGYVHDMAAAMFGGVSGHAGLFSTAEDLSIIMQMLLNGGIYGGHRFLDKKTIDLFTNYQSNTRRGYGWDKTEPRSNKSNPTADNCSFLTFGHTGFTGTCAWADPQHNIQFIFLSNRTYPSAETNLLSKLDIRTKAQQAVYDAFGISSKR